MTQLAENETIVPNYTIEKEPFTVNSSLETDIHSSTNLPEPTEGSDDIAQENNYENTIELKPLEKQEIEPVTIVKKNAIRKLFDKLKNNKKR